jgi:hypothetical protein
MVPIDLGGAVSSEFNAEWIAEEWFLFRTYVFWDMETHATVVKTVYVFYIIF